MPNQKSIKFEAVRDKNPFSALGRAVSYLMTKPNFKDLPFGEWSRVLTGQVNRGHYFFVVEGESVVGFVGWANVKEENALKWMDGAENISFDDSSDGDCIIINGWAADTLSVNRFILHTIRNVIIDKKVYAKRFYKDGSTRAVRLGANAFVKGHLERQSIK